MYGWLSLSGGTGAREGDGLAMVTGRRRRVLRGYTDLTVLRSSRLWTLYRAFDIETSQWVAMRVIPVGAVQSYLFDELESEISALEAINDHPNVATILRFLRRNDGSATIVTELCRESYGDRLRRDGPLAAVEVARVASRVASGLDAAAREGLVHRDVRPSKILLARSGEVVVGGFGLARLELATRSADDPVSAHTAPEVFGGGAPSPAADVYSLCSTMYELLAGRPPFEAFDGEAPASLLLRIVGEPAPPLRVAGVPLPLANLIAKGLTKDPAGRPATATQFAQELSAIPLDEPQGPDTVMAPAATPVSALAPQPRSTQPAPIEPGLARRAAAASQQSEPGVAAPIASARNVLAPITAGRGAPPVRTGTPRPDPAASGVDVRPPGPDFAEETGEDLTGSAG